MIGREAVTQPWIFRDIKAALRGEEIPPRPDIKAIMLDFSHLVEKHFPPDVALKRFKTAAHWLALNLAFGHHLMKLLNRATSLPEARARILAAFDAGMCLNCAIEYPTARCKNEELRSFPLTIPFYLVMIIIRSRYAHRYAEDDQTKASHPGRAQEGEKPPDSL
jgi:hypothetical protein